MLKFLAWTIIILGCINLLRLMALMVGTDLHDIKAARQTRRRRWPLISVLVPAYNEEVVIERCLDSLAANQYRRKEVLVIDDGSRDRTAEVVQSWIKRHPDISVKLIRQANTGKAAAINHGLAQASGSLIMVLDADSVLSPNALSEVPHYFYNPQTVLIAANVKIMADKKLFSLIQRYEYLISYRLKKALTHYNMEYIIGGVGSTFRASLIKQIGGYDTDTLTEDIDFSMKVVRQGNKRYRLGYAPSVIAYTEGVLTLPDLIKQRYRWKYGRMQTFLKNRDLFFNRHKRYDKRLSFFNLPYALWAELMFGLEPLLIGYFFGIVILYQDATTLLSAYLVTTIYLALHVIADETESPRMKLKLLPLAPFQYPLFFILSFVEYVALVKSLARLHVLRSSLGHSTWDHVARSGQKPVN
jgi:poly-beta-1,6-N-acetyl-D-glucosamine synthase